jgi:hypothetical protein
MTGGYWAAGLQGTAITVDGAIVDIDPIGRLLDTAVATSADTGTVVLPDAARLGRRMAALYGMWQRGPAPDLAALAAALLHRNAVDVVSPLGRTCVAAAAAVAAWGGLPYHSAIHHAEVATNAMVLVALAGLQGHPIAPHPTALLLAACLSHDIYYRPSLARTRFAAEDEAARALDVIAAAAGCDPADRHAMRALVIATDPGLRLRPGGPLGAPLDPEAVPLLGAAAWDPALATLAALLSDADLLSSVGLTTGWYRVQQDRLEREAGRPYEPDESERFFRDIVGPHFLSQPGQFFAGNLGTIRRDICGPD